MLQFLSVAPVASIIFIFTLITSIYAFYDPQLNGKFMLHPYSIARKTKYYTLVTSGLIHADAMHLFFNMYTFYAFAFLLEQYIGHWQFAVLYFACMILADIPSIIKHKEDFRYHSLGASGAISGVLFSSILFTPFQKIGLFILPQQLWPNSVIFGVLYLTYCYYMSKRSNDNINHDAHFFGALAGIVLTIILSPGIIPDFFSQISDYLGSF